MLYESYPQTYDKNLKVNTTNKGNGDGGWWVIWGMLKVSCLFVFLKFLPLTRYLPRVLALKHWVLTFIETTRKFLSHETYSITASNNSFCERLLRTANYNE